ncbi:hypothetical protein FAES_4015 [Fibrella aestuarina BUZ 2]|uniref:Uncharacterized protein n=1 Tax=Fibrella aestuarina BUZ 2 TaxID=1166018 RepID=I0KD12_9BACT|nr:hypothetical protein [Fibrella aestuarina]CCH02015.1 hypothetical protein FAES_4015 [Fibrella aestuarina BUZ 2]
MILTSRPNIPRADVDRLLADDTTPVRFRQLVDSQPLNLTGHLYEIDWMAQISSTRLAQTTNANIKRPDGAAAGLLEWEPRELRATLSDSSYAYMLFQVDGQGKREPRLWGLFKWITTPPEYEQGLPPEPAEIIFNYDTQTAQYEALDIYMPQGGADFTTEAAALAKPPKYGLTQYITIGGQPALNTPAGIIYLPANALVPRT